ncbi:kinase-like domain-containing protein [Mycena olivaceomarginata]|nr:kinase-like domain-containing protein [Mycena olivaceomarginata]
MTTRSPSVSSFLPSSSPNESRSFSPYAPWDPVRIPDAYSHYSKFKYRLWFICRTWYTIGSDSLPWFSLVSGENTNGDLWLWEDEDEEGIREFAIGNEPLYISEEDWDDAVLALEMCFFPDNGSRQSGGSPSLSSSTSLHGMASGGRVLPVWIETMLEIYPRDDLRSLPWHSKCNCLHSQLTATANMYSGQHGVPEIPLDRNSPVLHLFYELVVPSWPLFHWVVFRAGANNQAECLTTFMDMIHGPDQDLFTWNDDDNCAFLEVLTTDKFRPTLDQNWSALANFDLEEFWTSASLEDWLSACNEALCHGVWHTPMPFSERVQLMIQANNIIPCILVCEVKKSIEENSSANHTISTHLHENMKRDISAVMGRSVLLLRNQELYKQVLSSRGTDAQQLLDLLQDLLDLEGFSVAKPSIFEALLRLSRASGLHPRCLPLLGLQKVSQQLAGGGFGDIWKGLVRGQSVCIKIMRIFDNSAIEAVLKEFGREALICRQLCHPNVLPFFGVYYFDNRLCLVSPWMEDGHIMKFLAVKKPTTTKCLSLILDIALGLQYLHKQKIVHGDLKGANILVTPSHRACIADFGVSSIVKAITVRFTHTTAKKGGGTANYLSPELYRGEMFMHSHVFAMSVPFHDLQHEMAVMFKVLAGDHPSRPMSCSAAALDGLWALMQKCWKHDAQMRPTAAEIVEQLEGPSIAAQRTPFTMDWSEEFTSKFRRTLQAEPLLPSVTQIERMLFGDVWSPLAQQFKRRYEDLWNPKDAMTEESAAKKRKPWTETPSDSESDVIYISSDSE